MDKGHRIALWSGPRNISTALMYSFAQRKDTTVVDEPLYGTYLSQLTDAGKHPGSVEILTTMELDPHAVIREMCGKYPTPVVFFKNMTHHLSNLPHGFTKSFNNLVLTRNPIDMLPSFHDVIKNPTMSDVGYQAHVDLINFWDENNIRYTVLDSQRIQDDPKSQLELLCLKIGIEFDPSMLNWPAGARKEDGCWAKYWYMNVHKSTGFLPYKKKDEPFPAMLEPLLAECVPLYNKLLQKAL